jgi:LemA protein
MEPIPLIVIGCAALIIITFIWAFNSLVRLNERVNEAWSDITVQLKYRADLIPNLVEVVKGYAKHEKEAFSEVTKARKEAIGAKTVQSTSKADEALTSSLGKIFAIAENYPKLMASENYKKLQEQLQDVEDKIQAARRFYNNGVKDLNTKIKIFPSNIFARIMKFREKDYFEAAEDRKTLEKVPEVKL